VFLDTDGISIERPTDDLFHLTMAVARGERDKAAIAAELRRIAGSTARRGG
jgi:prophage maintenance system killer protein